LYIYAERIQKMNTAGKKPQTAVQKCPKKHRGSR